MNTSSVLIALTLASQGIGMNTDHPIAKAELPSQNAPRTPTRTPRIHEAIRRRAEVSTPKSNSEVVELVAEKLREERAEKVRTDYRFLAHQIISGGTNGAPKYNTVPRNPGMNQRYFGNKPLLRAKGRRGGQNWGITGAEDRT